MFSHIQVLVALLNDFQKGPLILTIIAAPIFIFAVALTTVVKSSNIDVIFMFTLFLISVDCVMAIMVILGQMATMYTKSTLILHAMATRKTLWLPVNIQKWEQKFYKSCSPLKILIGGANFVDSVTPLNCLQVAVTLAASILMLEGKTM